MSKASSVTIMDEGFLKDPSAQTNQHYGDQSMGKNFTVEGERWVKVGSISLEEVCLKFGFKENQLVYIKPYNLIRISPWLIRVQPLAGSLMLVSAR